jgi:uncharacterized membrane protein
VSRLVVAVFDDEHVAREALANAAELRAQGNAEIHDVCLVARDPDGKVHVRESGEISPRKATLYGSAWGLFAGAVIGFPIVAAAAGAAAARYAARRRDAGISDEFERSVAEQLKPGTSAVVVEVADAGAAEVEAAAARLGAWTRTVDVRS